MQVETRTAKTLQNLDRWLVGNGVSVRKAIFATESIGAFSRRIRSELSVPTMIGVETASVSSMSLVLPSSHPGRRLKAD